MRDYSRIIGIPHHEIKGYKRMTAYERAAQFSPFSALTGYEDAIQETARLTHSRINIAEDECHNINAFLTKAIDEKTRVRIKFFEKDKRKTGGTYKMLEGMITKHDDASITLDSGIRIKTEEIVSINTASKALLRDL